jgi:hypothetical protein
MKTSTIRLALVLLVAAAAAPAFAGGPLANCDSGQPFLWDVSGPGIPFNPDQGDLGPLTHAAAVAAVADSFNRWALVPTSTATYFQGAELPVDVDITNFEPYLDAPAPDGLSAIVFDDTGEIFDLLFGPGSGILGFAGPEWGDVTTCTITEGLSFLNGPAFDDLTAATDVMVHEFGHYSNLAHTIVNGQQFLGLGDTSGPTPNNTFGNPPNPLAFEVIETMYPFYFGPGTGTQNLNRDDVSMISTLYPEATFFTTTASIAGTIFLPDGATRLSGVNVIARNTADPFFDAVSAVSGDFTDFTDQGDPVTGTYRLNGLTPGASYAVYVDQILAGGFSTTPVALPGPEEFHNGAAESSDASTDDPSVFTAVSAAAGGAATGVNVIFNTFAPGDPLPVGDDDFVQLPLPFAFKMCGQEYNAVYVNANGSLTFGAGSTDFSESIVEFLGGPPRIAGVWDDLNSAAGGIVTFDRTANTFTVRWEDVPEFVNTGANTFSITLKRSSNQAEIEYGDLTVVDGLAGLSCGGAITSGFENEENLRTHGHRRTINMNNDTAAFEIFTTGETNDLAGYELTFSNFKNGFRDEFEPNDDIAHARRISPPFSNESVRSFSTVSPVGGDVDYFRFRVKAGDILALETVRGAFDSLIGVFDADTGDLLAFDDDGGNGLLSRLLLQANVDLNLAVAVTAYPDFDFNGAGESGGRYVLVANTYRGDILPVGDDTTTELPLNFPFRYQGATYNSVFVNSNGNVTFGAGNTDFSESVPELLAGPPRIAPLWDDLDGTQGIVVAEHSSHQLNLHFISVPEFFATSPNYFTVHLDVLGLSGIFYGATSRSDALVGVTEGGGAADPGETDFSARFPILSGRGTTYEQFNLGDTVDLSFRSLLFLPF